MPSATSELRRSLNAYNLRVGAPSAAALGVATLLATHLFGWRFDRGLRAATAGEHRHAVRLLAPVERPGMSHYDPDGSARRALAAPPPGGRRARVRWVRGGRARPAGRPPAPPSSTRLISSRPGPPASAPCAAAARRRGGAPRAERRAAGRWRPA